MTDLLVARELAHTTAASFAHENAENAVVAARARLLICAHVAPGLTAQLRTTQHPGQMLLVIKNRFAAKRAVLLPIAEYEWRNLRFCDYKRVNDYVTALTDICTRLASCGPEHAVSEQLKITKLSQLWPVPIRPNC